MWWGFGFSVGWAMVRMGAQTAGAVSVCLFGREVCLTATEFATQTPQQQGAAMSTPLGTLNLRRAAGSCEVAGGICRGDAGAALPRKQKRWAACARSLTDGVSGGNGRNDILDYALRQLVRHSLQGRGGGAGDGWAGQQGRGFPARR